jgi:hypothetical protein
MSKDYKTSSNPFLMGLVSSTVLSGVAKKKKQLTAADNLQKSFKKPETKEEVAAFKVKMQNKGFTAQLTAKAGNVGDYEDSDDSKSFSSTDFYQSGALMVVNLYLGKLGYQQIQCLSNANPFIVADDWCKSRKLGPKTSEQIAQVIQKRQSQFKF